MGKVLSIFIDESGDVGFIKDASKYCIYNYWRLTTDSTIHLQGSNARF